MRRWIVAVACLLAAGCGAGDGARRSFDGIRDPITCADPEISERDRNACYRAALRVVQEDPAECHGTMHESGRRAARRYDLSIARLPGIAPLVGRDENCVPGFLHGLMMGVESGVRNADDVRGIAGTCERFELWPDRRSCNHGTGHVLMRNLGGDLAAVLPECLGAGELASDCGVGALHDYSLGAAGLDRAPRPELAMEDPVRFCADVPTQLVASCWLRTLQNTSAVLRGASGVRAACDHVAPRLVDGCVRGSSAMLVLPAPQSWLDRPRESFLECERLPHALATDCVRAVMAPLRQFSPVGAAAFEGECAALAARLAQECVRALATVEANGPSPATARDLCDGVAAVNRDACDRGIEEAGTAWMQFPTAL